MITEANEYTANRRFLATTWDGDMPEEVFGTIELSRMKPGDEIEVALISQGVAVLRGYYGGINDNDLVCFLTPHDPNDGVQRYVFGFATIGELNKVNMLTGNIRLRKRLPKAA